MKRLATFLLAGLCASAMPAAAASGDYLVYVGSYTDAPSTAKGIYAWRFTPKTDGLTPLGLVAETVNPAYVAATPDQHFLYAVNWQTDDAAKSDTVSAYAIDRKTGALTFLDKVSSGGGLPNEVVVDPSGKMAAVANFGFHDANTVDNNSSLAMLPIETDGKLGEPFYIDHHTGPALSPRQTAGAHTHGAIFTKNNRFMYVAELALDRVYAYNVDAAARTVTPCATPYANVAAGSGPRRLQLSPNNKFLYVNHETDSKVSVFQVDGCSIKEIQALSTLPDGFTGRNSTAEIQLDHAGRFLYVSNRGNNTIALYAVDPAKGTLTKIENIPSLGQSPRNITIDPTGDYLFAANQGTGNVVIFKVNKKTGHLTPTGEQLPVSQAASVFFVKAD